MKNLIILLALLALWPGFVYGQINQDVVNSDVPGGGGSGGGLSQSDIDTPAKLNAFVTPDLADISSSQSLTNKLIDCNGNTCKPLRGVDCTAFNAATGGQYCVDTDNLVIYFCSVGTEEVCDLPGEWVAVSSATTLAGLTDVLLTAPQDGDMLSRSLGNWVNIVPPFLRSTNIDTFAELDTIVADKILVNTTDVQTLTNKAISGADNTLTNIPWAALVNVPPFRKTLFQLRPQANEPPASSFATVNSRNAHPALRFNGNVCAVWSFVMPNWYGGNGVTVDLWIVSSETLNDTDWDGSWERIATTQDIDSDSFATAISADNNNNNATSGIPTKVSIAFTNGAQMDSCAADELCRFKLCRDDTSDTGGADTIDFLGGQIRETP